VPSRTVVLDTNVLVSAALKEHSLPARILLQVIEGGVILVTCPAVAAEYVAVFGRPKFARWRFPPEWLEFVLSNAIHVRRDPKEWPLSGPDTDDLVFLALAHEQGATLVTGNSRHYPKGIHRGVEVLTPVEYVAWLDRAL
jgi:predicted nucleic acid-binding protein